MRRSARYGTVFALHPRWSLVTLAHGVPGFANNAPGRGETSRVFDRSRSRGGVDWAFLDALRDRWPRRLIVKAARLRRLHLERGDVALLPAELHPER